MNEIQSKLEWARAQFPIGTQVNYYASPDGDPVEATVESDWRDIGGFSVVAHLRIDPADESIYNANRGVLCSSEPGWRTTVPSAAVHAVEKRKVGK